MAVSPLSVAGAASAFGLESSSTLVKARPIGLPSTPMTISARSAACVSTKVTPLTLAQAANAASASSCKRCPGKPVRFANSSKGKSAEQLRAEGDFTGEAAKAKVTLAPAPHLGAPHLTQDTSSPRNR